MGNISHGDEDIAKCAVYGEKRGISYPNGQIWRVGTKQIALDIERGIRREGPPLGFGFFEGCALRVFCPTNDFGVIFIGNFFARLSVELLESSVDALYAVVGVEDENTIRGRF